MDRLVSNSTNLMNNPDVGKQLKTCHYFSFYLKKDIYLPTFCCFSFWFFPFLICYLRSQYINVFIEGKVSFNKRSLHAIGDTPNPYEKAISIIGKTLAPFDEDNLIPCFGFGDGTMYASVLNL